MFVWQYSVYYSSVHSSVLTWCSCLTNMTNENSFNFVKTLLSGVRPFGMRRKFIWTKIPSLDWETDSEALVCFFTSRCCCWLWKVAGQAFSSSPNSGPIPPFATDFHMTFPFFKISIKVFSHIQDITFLYITICNMYTVYVPCQHHKYHQMKSYMIMRTFLKSCVASLAWNAQRGKDLKMHIENLWASIKTIYFYFHPWWFCLDVFFPLFWLLLKKVNSNN